MANNLHIKKAIPMLAALVLPTLAQAGQTESVAAPAPQSDCEQGWTLGLEALFLRAYESEGNYDEGDYDFGGRVSLGYQFSDCLFTKVTYFGYSADVYSNDESDIDYSYEENADIEASYLDLVVGQHFKPSDKLTLSPYVGLRWGKFEENYDESENDDGDLYDYEESTEFSGFGILVGVDGTRSLANNFSLYGTAKVAVLFGESDHSWSEVRDNGEPSFDGDSYSDDVVGFVTELGLGVQYDFCFSNVAANIRAGVEGQWWSGLSDGDTEDTGLAGFVLGANFRF